MAGRPEPTAGEDGRQGLVRAVRVNATIRAHKSEMNRATNSIRLSFICLAALLLSSCAGGRMVGEHIADMPHWMGRAWARRDFFVTFDNFRTIGKCQLAWRHRDHIGVVFDRWVNVRAHVAVSDSNPA